MKNLSLNTKLALLVTAILLILMFVIPFISKAQTDKAFVISYMTGPNYLTGDEFKPKKSINLNSQTISIDFQINEKLVLKGTMASNKFEEVEDKFKGETLNIDSWDLDLRLSHKIHSSKLFDEYIHIGTGISQFTTDITDLQGNQVLGKGHKNLSGTGLFPGYGSGINGRTLESYLVTGFSIEHYFTKNFSVFVNNDFRGYLNNLTTGNKDLTFAVTLSFGASIKFPLGNKKYSGISANDFVDDPNEEAQTEDLVIEDYKKVSSKPVKNFDSTKVYNFEDSTYKVSMPEESFIDSLEEDSIIQKVSQNILNETFPEPTLEPKDTLIKFEDVFEYVEVKSGGNTWNTLRNYYAENNNKIYYRVIQFQKINNLFNTNPLVKKTINVDRTGNGIGADLVYANTKYLVLKKGVDPSLLEKYIKQQRGK